MYPNLNITLTQVKQHLKYLKTKQSKVDKEVTLMNDINNYLKDIIYLNCVNSNFLKKSSKIIEKNEQEKFHQIKSHQKFGIFFS